MATTGSLVAPSMSGSYVPQMGMAMDADTIKKQSGEATSALTKQMDAQSKML